MQDGSLKGDADASSESTARASDGSGPSSPPQSSSASGHTDDSSSDDPYSATLAEDGDVALASGEAAGDKVFLGGLPSDTTEQELRDYFGRFGAVTHVTLPTNKVSNQASQVCPGLL